MTSTLMDDGSALIDRWFPVAAVDAAVASPAGSGANEKSIFPWFASRPVAQARAAVLCALLADDDLRPDVEAAIRGEREGISRAAKAVQERYGRPPVVLDVFSGRGMIPLEAARFGASAVGLDLSPVAVIAGRVLADYPLRDWSEEPELPWCGPEADTRQLLPHDDRPRFFGDLETFLAEIGARVRMNLGASYPPNPDGSWPWGYLWAISIPCDRCNRRFPLLGSLVLRPPYAKKKDPGQSLRVILDDTDWSVEVVDGVPQQQPTYSSGLLASGKKRKGKSARCPYASCSHVHPLDTVKAKGSAGQYRDELLAACDLVGGAKVFRSVRQDERAAAAGVSLLNLPPAGGLSAVPDELIPDGNVHTIMASGYGYQTFGSLMCDRQALQFVETVRVIRACATEVVEAGCSLDYARALAEFACANLARRLRRSTRGCSVQSKGKLDGSASNTVFMSDLFLNESKLNFQFDWFETGVDEGPSTWRSLSKNGLSPYLTHIKGLGPAARPARIRQGNAMALPYRDGTVDVVVTDPPYYDMVEYADGSDLFFVWLRRALYDLEPELFGDSASTQESLQNKDDEIILRRVHEPGRVRHDRDFYESALARAFGEARRVLKSDGHLVVVFGHSDPEAWRRLLNALRNAGFVVTSAWPARTESANTGVASIKVTVTIGCRVAPTHRGSTTAAQAEREIVELIRKRVEKWDEWQLALSDQLMASYGPAMQVVGQYRTIQRPDGTEPDLDHFLAIGRRAVVDAHTFKVDELPLDTFDAHTRFAVFWMRAFKRTTVNKGEAVFHAQSSQMRIDELRPHILEETKGGYAITLGEPPAISDRSPVFHVARAVAAAWQRAATEGVAETIAASGRMPDDAHLWATIAELVRQLPESDKTAMALTACQRNRRAIETETRRAIVAVPNQMTLDSTGDDR